jgi:hypothetical protein
MNIYTVAENLRKTIAGKEYMLQELRGMKFNEIGKNIANDATIKFLSINIDELKRILQDVEKCCEIETSRSWEGSVDRMSGAFDESELRGRDGWS